MGFEEGAELSDGVDEVVGLGGFGGGGEEVAAVWQSLAGPVPLLKVFGRGVHIGCPS